MARFELDSRLANDCFTLGELDTSLLLLMNNSLLPWFILVPQTVKTEIIELTESEQCSVQNEINLLGSFIKNYFAITKLNIAAIGNIVSQLHIHIVGRHPSDYCWPNVVWGTTENKHYSDEQVTEIITTLGLKLGDNFKRYDQA